MTDDGDALLHGALVLGDAGTPAGRARCARPAAICRPGRTRTARSASRPGSAQWRSRRRHNRSTTARRALCSRSCRSCSVPSLTAATVVAARVDLGQCSSPGASSSLAKTSRADPPWYQGRMPTCRNITVMLAIYFPWYRAAATGRSKIPEIHCLAAVTVADAVMWVRFSWANSEDMSWRCEMTNRLTAPIPARP